MELPPIDEDLIWEEVCGGQKKNRVYGKGAFFLALLSLEPLLPTLYLEEHLQIKILFLICENRFIISMKNFFNVLLNRQMSVLVSC
ncbi:uncharacterized protein DS421_19g676220 [Arachis hypogaea]|uniref:Uncharacterized protein n=1 Tax=Arachis hypogaea TaxID=3818 RepID=A0A6B9VHQ0_ARAHY|nr:uncharacterized protein DS421_19g676220 [Arachis hypogaea]